MSSAQNLYSPDLSYNLALDYRFQMEGGGVVRPRIALSHTGSSYSSLFQRDDYFLNDERNLVNLSVGYEREDWDLHLYCNNCTDKYYIASVEDVSGNRVIYGPPRTAGLRFRRDF